MKIKTVIFDFDGTLGDSKECVISSTKKAFEGMSMNIPSDEEIKYYMGIPLETSLREMAGENLSEEDFAGLLEIFRDYTKKIEKDCLKIFPEVRELLDTLKEKGIKCFIVSSKKSSVLERNLKFLEIYDYFIDIIGPDEVSNHKPHPEGINMLVEKYGFSKPEAIMVGDAIFDIQMGKSAGVHTCGVTWGSHSVEMLEGENPDIMIESPLELLKYTI